LVLLLIAFGVLLRLPMPPRSSWLLLWLLLAGITGFTRIVLRDVFLVIQARSRKNYTRVAIYGAGSAGVQLAAALRLADGYSIESFFDDDTVLWHRSINGVQIEPPHNLKRLACNIDYVLLAIPSLSPSRRRQIVDLVQGYGLKVLQIPSVEEITSGRARIDTLRPIQVEELLGRDAVYADSKLLGAAVNGASICVTGAGGSIGSELCRQILRLKPSKLLLLERSEPNLYTIHQELLRTLPAGVELLPILGSADNQALVDRCFLEYGIEIILHTAAYKHVPLVESNPLEGLANNAVSTRVICEAARRCGARKMILISTDKAVRPTNVMGASKRLAELILQAQPAGPTIFAMVRFGNVLGSSGSVVPLFRRQIESGGPITLTHPEVIRYFMTIAEASQLVLQATALAKGGDVLLLDMGEPIRIKSLAEQMIRLSGLTVKNDSNIAGDIEIVCTGLRPGEKLFEELLISAESQSTLHPLIFRAQENCLPPENLWPKLKALESSIKQRDLNNSLSILATLVPEWESKIKT